MATLLFEGRNDVGSNSDVRITNNGFLAGNNMIIHGNNNTITGDYNNVKGNGNIVTGDQNTVTGTGNDVIGNGNYVHGTGNNAIGRENTISPNSISDGGYSFSTLSDLMNIPILGRRQPTETQSGQNMSILIGGNLSEYLTIREEEEEDYEEETRGGGGDLRPIKIQPPFVLENCLTNITIGLEPFNDGLIEIRYEDEVIKADKNTKILKRQSDNAIVENIFPSKKSRKVTTYECTNVPGFKLFVYKNHIKTNALMNFPKLNFSRISGGRKRRRESSIITDSKGEKKRKIVPTIKAEKISETSLKKDSGICVVCFQNEVNTIIVDCRHGCLCSVCAKKILKGSGKCPICRIEINEGIDNLYLS